MKNLRKKLKGKSLRKVIISVLAITFILGITFGMRQIKTMASMENDGTPPSLVNDSVKAITSSGWINYDGTYEFKFKLTDNNGVGIDNSDVNVTVNGKTSKAEYDSSSNTFSASFSAKDYIGENPAALGNGSSFQLNYTINCKDLTGNAVSISNSISSSFKYDQTLPRVSNVTSAKVAGIDGTTNVKWLKFGDKIKVSFNVDDDNSGIDPKALKVTMINSVSATIDNGTLVYDKEKGCATATFTVGIGRNKVFSLLGQPFNYKIYASDNAGNTYGDENDRLTPQLIDNVPPTADSVTITSENSNKAVAKKGDKLDIAFTADEDVTISSVEVGSKDIKLSDKDAITLDSSDNKNWKINYKLDGSEIDDNNIISFKIVIKDIAGNLTTVDEKNIKDKVTYYAPIKINNATFKSSNSNPVLAKNGDTVTLAFTTSHPVNFDANGGKVNIAGKDITFSSSNNDGMNWFAVYQVENKVIEDNTQFHFTNFVAADAAGNDLVNTKQSDVSGSIIYYAPIEANNIKIVSDNSKDSAKYAKDGDTVTVTFNTKHPVSIINAKIAEKDVDLRSTNDDGRNWSASYKINNGDVTDLNNITFTFTAKDEAQNDLVTKNYNDSDVTNRIQYFAPITCTTSVSSNGNNKTYAMNGSKIISTLSTNHNVTVSSAAIFDRGTTDVSGNDSNSLTVSYLIPAVENSIPEGSVKIAIDLTDAAGNTLAVRDTNDNPKSNVTYDRTKPTVTVRPIFNGFTNKNISYTVTFEDTNLDSNGISLKQNGVEEVSGENRSTISQGTKSFTKQIDLSDENNYDIVGTVTDLAGNKPDSDVLVNITIDKTDPKIESTKINFEKAMAFKKGFKISDYFTIDDKNLSNIVCKVTDENKTQLWNINTPIMEDGKKTIYLLATDEAGNSSKALTYDLYIDGTAPKVLLKDTVSKKNLNESSKQTFISSMDLKLSLAKLNIGNERPDRITEISLEDKDGKVKDILKDSNTKTLADNEYEVPLKDFGKYKVVVKAEDDVNNIATSEYTFTLKDKSVLEKYYDNKPLFYSSISSLIVILMVGLTLGLIKSSKTSKVVDR